MDEEQELQTLETSIITNVEQIRLPEVLEKKSEELINSSLNQKNKPGPKPGYKKIIKEASEIDSIKEVKTSITKEEVSVFTKANLDSPTLLMNKKETNISKEDIVEREKQETKGFSVFTSKEELEKSEKGEAQVFEQKREERVYKLSYFEGEKELVYFSAVPPIFFKTDLGIERIRLVNCFKKYTLRENVLGKKLIKVSYKSKEKISEIDVDLRIGIILKTVAIEKWMRVNQDIAKDFFTKRVLDTYREYSKSLTGESPIEELESF